jgi:hypothetical protein
MMFFAFLDRTAPTESCIVSVVGMCAERLHGGHFCKLHQWQVAQNSIVNRQCGNWLFGKTLRWWQVLRKGFGNGELRSQTSKKKSNFSHVQAELPEHAHAHSRRQGHVGARLALVMCGLAQLVEPARLLDRQRDGTTSCAGQNQQGKSHVETLETRFTSKPSDCSITTLPASSKTGRRCCLVCYHSTYGPFTLPHRL